MYFASVRLKNFGPFRYEEFSFQPYGINWLVGANASGKTQLVGAILGAVVGAPAVDVEPEGPGPTIVELDIREGSQSETARLDVYETPTGRIQIDKSTGPLSVTILAEVSRTNGQQMGSTTF